MIQLFPFLPWYEGFYLLWNARVLVGGKIEGRPKCFAGVYHQLLALQWHIRGKARSRLDCGREFRVSPPRFERHVLDQIEVIGSQWVSEWSYWDFHWECMPHWVVYSWEASHMMGRRTRFEFAHHGGIRTSQIYAYQIWGWMIHLLEARWEHRVHLSDSASSGNYNRIGFHFLLHAHHGLHHCGHLLFHVLQNPILTHSWKGRDA